MALVTLDKFKRAIRETSAANDTLHQEALDDASAAVASYTDRDLGVALVTADRTFRYDGSGFLEIDDAAVVNSVRYTTSSTPLSTAVWEPHRDGPAGTPYSYITLAPIRRVSGEMGFTYNLDRAIERGLFGVELDIIVNAEWGWAVVPNDIQRAVIWTAAAYETQSESFGGTLASESVAEVARAYAFQGALQANAENEDLPPRAKGLLEKYRRHVL